MQYIKKKDFNWIAPGMGRIKSYFSRDGEFEIVKHLGEQGPWIPHGIPPISYNLCEIAKDVDKVLLNPLCCEFWERGSQSSEK